MDKTHTSLFKLYGLFDNLRFPLIILVIFVHGNFFDDNVLLDLNSVYYTISQLISVIIASVAVPTFFIISGCLFFRDYPNFNKSLYISKLKKRLWTLFVPYILWNLIIWGCFSVFKTLLPSFTSGGIPSLVGFSFHDVYQVFFAGPIDYPLWYVRDLIIMTILAPLIYYIILKPRIGYIFLLALLLSWMAGYQVLLFGNNVIKPLLFFSLGAFINKINYCAGGGKMVEDILNIFQFKTFCYLFICAYLFICVLVTYINVPDYKIKVITLMGILSIFLFVYLFQKPFTFISKKIDGGCIFFIFAVHGQMIVVTKRVISKLIEPTSIYTVPAYFLNIITITITCIVLYKIAKKIAPHLMSILVGR